MKSVRIRLLGWIVTVAMLVSLFAVPFSVNAEEANDAPTTGTSTQTSTLAAGEYEKYLSSISQYKYAKEDIVIDALSYKEVLDCDFTVAGEGGETVKSVLSEKIYEVLKNPITQEKVSTNCLVWRDDNTFKQRGSVTYTIEVAEDGIYNIQFEYLPLNKTGSNDNADDDKTSTNPIELGVKIDGKYLYAGLDGIKLPRYFINNGASFDNPSGGVRVDTLGNELTPEQIGYDQFVTAYAVDPIGVVDKPYKIFLSKGTHNITLVSEFEPFALANITLKVPTDAISYEEYAAAHSNANKYDGAALEIEGEDAWLKSTNSIVSKADNSSPDVKPSSPVKSSLNYIGSTNWSVPGDSLSWVVKVPKDGLYKLGFNYKQASVIDGFTYRTLQIDGETPFKECENMRFNYCTAWTFYEFGTDKTPYLFYLTEGTHVLTMKVTLGETAPFYSELGRITDIIGDTYIDIVMITSDSPDPNRDYDLFRQIPNFLETLQTCYDDLNKLIADMSAVTGDRSTSYISALRNMARVLKEMHDNQYTAQEYVADYYTNYTTVCSWLYEMKNMPVSIDQFQLVAPEKEHIDNHAGFWTTLVFEVKRFFASFSDDFSTIGGSAAADAKGNVRIWVNWGRDQCQVLSNLIQDSFTYETGISVQLEIVSASLINGILAGNFPDLSLHLSRTDPVNLGMRGALYDLTNFSAKKDSKFSTVDDGSTYLLDYETVLKRFQESADRPYWYNNGLYALPDTQGFFIMFYRTDIFENLGIEDPNTAHNGQGWTWDDFLDATTIIQRNNMESYIPYVKIAAAGTVNAGMGSLHLFPTMLSQNNVELYNDELNATTLTTSDAIAAFQTWTDFYNKHGIQKEINFYNRFRVGTVPLGVAGYTTYTTLTQAAPEIQGRWSIAAIPGVMQEDGTINRSIAGSGTGCSVVAPSTNKEAAWQFLCWWTSAQTQLRYNNNVESILGAVSRTATANVEAFSSYSWNADDLEKLNYQWSQVKELPEVPGGYYVSRAVDQAFWAVLNGKDNEKDAMLEWGKVADNEIKRKIAEYSK